MKKILLTSVLCLGVGMAQAQSSVVVLPDVDQICRTDDVRLSGDEKIAACIWKLRGQCTMMVSEICVNSKKCFGAVQTEFETCPASYEERLKKTMGYRKRREA